MIVVFLGPSLPRHDARRLLRADYRPPARQGDVFRAIDAAPDAIVLIDGVFESAPGTITFGAHAAFVSVDTGTGRVTVTRYVTCDDAGVVINRPPRDGRMAFVRSPDNISIELLQEGGSLPPQEPWASMPNVGVW